MKLRAKIILTAASLALSCALLAGCGSSSGSTASSAASSEPASTVLSQASSIPLGEDNSTDALNAPFETLLDANPISNQFEIAAMNIEYDFNLPAEDVVSYKGVKSNDNGDAGLVLVVEAASGKGTRRVVGLRWRATSRIRWLSTATTPSLHRHRTTWKTPSSPPRATVWSW